MSTLPWIHRLVNGDATGLPDSGRAPHPAVSASVDPELGADRCVAEIRRILGRFGKRRQLGQGASLFDGCDTSRHVYIVTRGTIDVGLPETPGPRPIASFHSGACFLVDFGNYQVATLEAAETSEVIDIPFTRLKRLCRQEMDVRLLLRQCQAFDLRSFLDTCYPARSRFRLVREAEAVGERSAAAPDPGARSERAKGAQFLIPLGPQSLSQYAGNRSRIRNGGKRLRRARGRTERNMDGEG